MHTAIAAIYGTEKLAAPEGWRPLKGGLPLAALVGGALLYAGAHRGARRDTANQQVSREATRAFESNRMSGVDAALRGGVPLSQPGSTLYQNERADSNIAGDFSMFDKGASIYGAAAGVQLAKYAGIGGAISTGVNAITSKLPSMGWKSKALAGAGLVGGGLLAAKGARKAYAAGMAPPTEERLGGHNAALPSYVNQFGVPTMG